MIQFYNTFSRKKEEFKPIIEHRVGMYACGLTVYDYAHLGHARQQITYDMIVRYLTYRGYDVTYVRNITDIDDKIINRAAEQKISCQELTAKFIATFYEDMRALGVAAPTQEPRATDHIAEIITLIKKLEERGLAYQAGTDVFYAVRKFTGYGQLSGKNIEELEAGSRVEVDQIKRDPLDFVLWKGAKPGEPKWPSPWGEGRPGWHIECSAMGIKYLGEHFDIHGGGRDLIFPHHENEIAQSEGATGKKFVNYWVHNGFLNIDSEKMSKSLGNFFTIRDVLSRHTAEAIRLFMVSSHYRSPIDYTEQNIHNAQSSLERYYQTLERLHTYVEMRPVPNPQAEHMAVKIDQFKNSFIEAMDDDFNSAKVVGMVFEWVRVWNRLLDENALKADDAEAFLHVIADIHTVLGVFGTEPKMYFSELKAKSLKEGALDESAILALIEERAIARKSRNFRRADDIRKELADKGVELKDALDGTTGWTIK